MSDGQIIVGTLGRGVFSVLQAEVEALRTSSDRTALLPDRQPFALTPSWPNPFSRSTTIGFKTAQAAPVRIEVYDVTGRQVNVLTDSIYTPGRHKVDWRAGPQSSGVYFVRMLADGRQVDTKRMVLRKLRLDDPLFGQMQFDVVQADSQATISGTVTQTGFFEYIGFGISNFYYDEDCGVITGSSLTITFNGGQMRY